MNAIANLTNWHRYVIGGLGVLGAILAGVIADPAIVPSDLHAVVSWAPFLMLVDGSIIAGLPRFQLSAGPGAPDVVSPPTKV